MRLLAKFSLIFAVVFGLGLAAAALLFHDSLQRSAREQVLHEAQIMMETALAMRNYTTEQIRPAMNEISQPYDSQAVDPISRICAREAAAKRTFRPQTVPAFAATEIFNYLRKKYPDYNYKEASLNPTNPRNRVVDWEEERRQSVVGEPVNRLDIGSDPTAAAAGVGASPMCVRSGISFRNSATTAARSVVATPN